MPDVTAEDAARVDAAEEAALQSKVFTRVAWRVLPVLVVAYLFNYVDRTNISIAALQMNHAVGLTASQFGYGAGLLFVGYCLFEIPSNLALYRFGARLWIARIMITWGLVSAAMVFCSGATSFYMLRFLLGVAEAGFFPGVAFYLSSWFPSFYRARILAWFLVSIPASSLIGAPVAGLLLRMDGIWGLAGWQWLFLLESLPCVLIGLALPRLMPNTPRDARWLSGRERDVAERVLAAEDAARRVAPKVVTGFLPSLLSGRVWLLGLIYLSFSTGSYGVQLWLPIILKGTQQSDTAVSLLVAIPYLFSVAGMIFWAWFVDRYGRRLLNVILTCAVASASFVLALLSHDLALVLSGITLALLCLNAARAIFWAIPSLFLSGAAAAGGLALISSIGTLGGFIGPAVMGWLKDETGSFTAGLIAMAGFLALASLLAILLHLITRDARAA